MLGHLATRTMRPSLVLGTILVFGTVALSAQLAAHTRAEAARFVLDDYCPNDCAGYRRTRSPRFRRTFARALAGDHRALRRVFRDPDFHSGDNESWEPVPGNLLFVVGDRRFAGFLSGLPPEERRFALAKIPIAAPFHDAELAGQPDYFPRQVPPHSPLLPRRFPTLAGGVNPALEQASLAGHPVLALRACSHLELSLSLHPLSDSDRSRFVRLSSPVYAALPRWVTPSPCSPCVILATLTCRPWRSKL